MADHLTVRWTGRYACNCMRKRYLFDCAGSVSAFTSALTLGAVSAVGFGALGGTVGEGRVCKL